MSGTSTRLFLFSPLVLALSLTGCGGGGGNDDDNGTPANPQVVNTTVNGVAMAGRSRARSAPTR
jgi:hypothetical protein